MPESPAERRCRRLLLAYPAAYRASRGDEIVATMLDSSPYGGGPSLADQIDVVAAGLRQRLGTARIPGLHAGLVAAAPVALALAAGISGFALVRIEPLARGEYVRGAELLGVFRTLAPVAYAFWLLAFVGFVALRPPLARALIAVAVTVTVVAPVVAPLTTVERPPMWVVMALAAFGLLALAGTSPAHGAVPPTIDERLAVASGGLAVAVGGWLVTPAGVGYYQPTVARVGMVVTASVAAVAVVALMRRGRSEWLWAVALLGLPAGWLGPFLASGTLTAAPRFGRLAQVLLATSVAAVALAWLARRRPRDLVAVGACALGTAGGLLTFALLARSGHLGFAAGPVPPYVWAGIAALALAGLLAGGATARATLWAPVAFGACFGVAIYDYHWSLHGWENPGATLSLAMALAVPPLAACAYAAAATRVGRSAPVLVVSIGWIGYVALPYVASWGPGILVLLACGLALYLSRRARAC